MMAKALAGEAGIPFISTNGAEFVEVRTFFERLRELGFPPTIVHVRRYVRSRALGRKASCQMLLSLFILNDYSSVL
jgi:hypothetical protein